MNLSKYQAGAATLVTTMVLGMLMTMIVVFTSQTTSMGFKIAGNTKRTSQAFYAANGGLHYALTHLTESVVEEYVGEGETYTFTDTPTLTNASGQIVATYQVSVTRVDPSSDEKLKITSHGFTDDNTSGRPNSTVSVMVKKQPLKAYTPVPVVGKNSVRMGFYTKVTNYSGNETAIWTGGGITLSNIVWDLKDEYGNLSTHKGLFASDENFVNATGDRFFENFFSQSKESAKMSSTVVDCTSGCTHYDIQNIEGAIWVDGDIDIGTSTIGSSSNPIMLFATGNVNFSGSYTDFNGVIYGNTITSNEGIENVRLSGAFIAEDVINIDGQTQVIYDVGILEKLTKDVVVYNKMYGTWSDM